MHLKLGSSIPILLASLESHGETGPRGQGSQPHPWAERKPGYMWSYAQRLAKIVVIYIVTLVLKKWLSGPQFNIKMTSYQYRKSHCGDKTILRPFYLHNGISYTGKTSLYWIGAQVLVTSDISSGCLQPPLSAQRGIACHTDSSQVTKKHVHKTECTNMSNPLQNTKGNQCNPRRAISQIPQCIRQISHNAPFCNRNVHMCAHFCYKLWDLCNIQSYPNNTKGGVQWHFTEACWTSTECLIGTYTANKWCPKD